ncbi:TIGR02234 family membrane protein [Nocardia huaxiensis]|uniref:TIGR02234 family membrane protein n=1 Tax=Nocardia huaxiensis TaxID=2755382 RepID=A0A7D6ZL01_9NOCA|nr:TIGR02234 family membrane protein [Nocardia huaxiensis]QLY33739.1 TIGR02234 family membrane protein [Nocardia huaxiensis]UFS99336.1 TIGR02234 family membrane protein [Nocardia huaxiensis]
MSESDPDRPPKTAAAQHNPDDSGSAAGGAADTARVTPAAVDRERETVAAQIDTDVESGPEGIRQRALEADLREAEANAAQAEADAAAAEIDAAGARRRPVVAALLLAVAAGLLWVSSRMTWVSFDVVGEVGDARTMRDETLDGGEWFGALTPLALALLATVAAVFATRGWFRRLVGVIVGVLAAVAAVPAYALLRGEGRTAERAATLADLRSWEVAEKIQTSAFPAWLSIAGALAAFAAALLLVRMPVEAVKAPGKYDNPAARKAAATDAVAAAAADRGTEAHAEARDTISGSQRGSRDQLSGRVLWDALDEGVDPTDDETNRGAAHDDPGSGGVGDRAR